MFSAQMLLIPIGVLGLIRWLAWLARRLPAIVYKTYESEFTAPVSLVAPVYQEDPAVFRAAIESWLRNDLAEIICVIDETDASSIRIAAEYDVEVIITDVPGKRDALRRGWEVATSPIIALVDSDVVWADDVRSEILKPFADPGIGGVGTRQNVLEPESIWQHINDMFLDYRYFDEIASQTRVGQAISCLSGRTAVYRRDLLLEISDDFMSESFLGRPCNSGEDKRLTTLIQERGHRSYCQRSARAWSAFPPDASTFFKQRLRWSRNTWRSDLRAIKRGWIFRHKFLAFTTIDKGVSSFTSLISPTYMVFAIARGLWVSASILAVWWFVSRSIKHLPHLRRRPHHIFIIPAFVLISFAVAFVKIYALATIRTQRWLTRDVEVDAKGDIVRTNEPAKIAVPVPEPTPTLVAASVSTSPAGELSPERYGAVALAERPSDVEPRPSPLVHRHRNTRRTVKRLPVKPAPARTIRTERSRPRPPESGRRAGHNREVPRRVRATVASSNGHMAESEAAHPAQPEAEKA